MAKKRPSIDAIRHSFCEILGGSLNTEVNLIEGVRIDFDLDFSSVEVKRVKLLLFCDSGSEPKLRRSIDSSYNRTWYTSHSWDDDEIMDAFEKDNDMRDIIFPDPLDRDVYYILPQNGFDFSKKSEITRVLPMFYAKRFLESILNDVLDDVYIYGYESSSHPQAIFGKGKKHLIPGKKLPSTSEGEDDKKKNNLIMKETVRLRMKMLHLPHLESIFAVSEKQQAENIAPDQASRIKNRKAVSFVSLSNK